MRTSDSRDPSKPRRRGRWALAGVLLAAVMLIAAGWWWTRGRGLAVQDQQARLAAALERGRALSAELAGLGVSDAPDCPPGQKREAIAPAAGNPAQPTPTPAAPEGASAVSPADPAKALTDTALAERLEQATAMVLVIEANGLSTGTGFFVARNLFVTNRHVVERSPGKVYLTSSALGSVRRATVVSTTTGSDPGTPDFALLRMDEGTAPGMLDTTPGIAKLSAVVAAGFPGLVVTNDPKFQRLLRGDVSAAPDLNLTQGAVQSLQDGAGGMPLIVHTASLAKGNSGGPLVDACGRLVGVNTFINVDQSQSARINYAIRAQAMVAFLQSAGAAVQSDARPCLRR